MERSPTWPLLGYYSVHGFDPQAWRPNYWNGAFEHMTERDAAWMARIIARFRPEHLRAVVALGRFSDPAVEARLIEVMRGRRQALLMQGFLQGQLRGRSAVAATFEYVYPVWTHLDGRVHLSTGNVFAEHLSDFRAERLRFSFGVGLATAGDPGSAFQITVAAGTAPLIRGAGIESIQLVIGSRQGL